MKGVAFDSCPFLKTKNLKRKKTKKKSKLWSKYCKWKKNWHFWYLFSGWRNGWNDEFRQLLLVGFLWFDLGSKGLLIFGIRWHVLGLKNVFFSTTTCHSFLALQCFDLELCKQRREFASFYSSSNSSEQKWFLKLKIDLSLFRIFVSNINLSVQISNS